MKKVSWLALSVALLVSCGAPMRGQRLRYNVNYPECTPESVEVRCDPESLEYWEDAAFEEWLKKHG